MFKRIISYLKYYWAKTNSERYCQFLQNKGVKVGVGTHINAKTCLIDITRPSLVTIGDNCFIGAGSIVTKDIPSNVIAVGSPCKVVMTLEEYYQKRLQKCEAEALEYARSIHERFGRKPEPKDFWEEFRFFVSGDEVDLYPEIPIKKQLGPDYERYVKNHKAKYSSFNDFLRSAMGGE